MLKSCQICFCFFVLSEFLPGGLPLGTKNTTFPSIASGRVGCQSILQLLRIPSNGFICCGEHLAATEWQDEQDHHLRPRPLLFKTYLTVDIHFRCFPALPLLDFRFRASQLPGIVRRCRRKIDVDRILSHRGVSWENISFCRLFGDQQSSWYCFCH